MKPPTFVIIDHSAMPVLNLEKIAAALTTQLNRDASAFRPYGWGYEGDVLVARPTDLAVLDPDEIICGLFDHPDQPGALGYHDHDPRGVPYIKVFPLLDAADGCSVSSTLSHEILETVGDPDGNSCVQSPIDGRVWAQELCDAVETDTYLIDGVEVSNFVLPHYFAPPRSGSPKYDFMEKCVRPYEIRPGGYGQYIGPDGAWKQVYPEGAQRRASFRVGHKTHGYCRLRQRAAVFA